MTSILLMVLMVTFSAYFSATETAFSSLNRTRIQVLADKGDRRAALTLSLARQYDRMITSILIGNNIVNIAFSSICTVLFIDLLKGGDSAATVATVVSTIVVLVFGEVTPKSMAKESPERFAMFSAPFLKAIMWVLTPFAWLFAQLKKLVGRVVKAEGDRAMTQEELLLLVDEAQQEGGLDENGHQLLRSAIEFTDRDAEDILTHRVDLEAVSLHADNAEVSRVFADSRFSRLLVYDRDLDDIVGVVHQSDFFNDCVMGGRKLAQVMTPPLFVPKTLKISALLKLLQREKIHIAVVSDGYGGTLGIVTMEDILEELVGEIWDEHDEVTEDIRSEGGGVWTVAGSADLHRLLEQLALDGDSVESTSVTGWVMERLGRIPANGDCFREKDWQITVLRVDDRRVEQLRVERLTAAGEQTSGD